MKEKNSLIDQINNYLKDEQELIVILSKRIDFIIKNRINDIDLIEHTLDSCMDLLNPEGDYLFCKLCNYYYSINKCNALEYKKIYVEHND